MDVDPENCPHDRFAVERDVGVVDENQTATFVPATCLQCGSSLQVLLDVADVQEVSD